MVSRKQKKITLACLTPVKHISGLYEFICSFCDVVYIPYFCKKDIFNLKSANALFVNPNQMNYKIDESILGGINVVVTASTGTNHIDLNYCKSAGIDVLSLTTEKSTIEKISSTAEHAFTLLMMLIRNVNIAYHYVFNKKWVYEPFIGRQMNGLKIGIVGYGRLGKMMSNYCAAFGSKVFICDPYKKSNLYQNLDICQIFDKCDVVSLHVHLKEDTKNLVSRDLLNRNVKYLINTSRGEIVNECDVIKSLESGSLIGYAADVVTDELGNVRNSILIDRMKDLNIIITPHIGGMTVEAQHIAYFRVAEMLKEWAIKNDQVI